MTTSMPYTSTARPALPSTQCTWWCEDGDGHPGEHFVEDQECHSAPLGQVLETMPLVDMGGYQERSRLEVQLWRETDGQARIDLNMDMVNGAAPKMRLVEAEALARKLLLLVNTARMEQEATR